MSQPEFNPDRVAPMSISIDHLRDWLKLMTPQERLAFIHKAMQGYCWRCGEMDDECRCRNVADEWKRQMDVLMAGYCEQCGNYVTRCSCDPRKGEIL